MPRRPRTVLPGVPHHVTQRGGRRLQVFFELSDYERYLELLWDQSRRERVEIWAYCLMPNHVHLIAVPGTPTGLARALGRAHRAYAVEVNRRRDWRGHLWQERFWSCALSERHLRSAVAYVLLNPVRAGLVERPEQWPHSSAAALLGESADPLAESNVLKDYLSTAPGGLSLDLSDSEAIELRRHTSTGRPLEGR